MSISIDPRVGAIGLVGAVGVIGGVVLKNSSKQLGQKSGTMSDIGMALFVLGWMITAYSIGGFADPIPWVAAGVILGAVIAITKAKEAGVSPVVLAPIAFVAGWLLLAYAAGGGDKTKSMIAFGAAISVLVSMMVFMPKQRAQGIVDGPGLPLFALGWAGMVFANAMV